MNRSKLISILSTFSTRELREFEEFINSPFFNKNPIPIALFDLVMPHHPAYGEEAVAMERIFPLLFPGEPYEEQRLRYAMTDLTKLLETYLSYTEFSTREIFRRYLLMTAYSSRNLDKYFRSTYDGARTQQENSPFRNVDYYFERYLLEEKAYQHSNAREQNIAGTTIQAATDNLDYYYLCNKLRYCCFLLARQSILKEDYHNILFDEILQYLQGSELLKVPAIAIYYRILLTLLENTEVSHYFILKQLVETHYRLFPTTELQDIYSALLNFCIRRVNSGDSSFTQELFEQYKAVVDREIVYENGYITPHEFKNIVVVGLKAGQIDWVDEFIATHKDKLLAEHRENTYLYNMAFLLHYRGDFSQSLRLLQSAEFKDVYYHLDARALLLRTYYELEESEPFFSLVDAFTNYLKRNKLISDYQRTLYLNFVRLIRKLMNIRLGGRQTFADLSAELNSTRPLANLQWMQEKLAELEAR